MLQSRFFSPPKRFGNIFQAVILVSLICLVLLAIYLTSRSGVDWQIVLLFSLISAAFVLILFLAYRIYSLNTSSYQIGTQGIQINWGLRREFIPMNLVQWVLPESELNQRIPKPCFRWPGAVLGKRRVDKTCIEFMSSSNSGLLLIARQDDYFAINPEKLDEFLAEYQRLSELGTIDSIAIQSTSVSAIIFLVWRSTWSRILILLNILVQLFLIGLAIWLVLQQGDNPIRGIQQPEVNQQIQSIQLLLIPVLSTGFLFINLIFGGIIFAITQKQYISYLIWITGFFTTFLFIFGLIFLLQGTG